MTPGKDLRVASSWAKSMYLNSVSPENCGHVRPNTGMGCDLGSSWSPKPTSGVRFVSAPLLSFVSQGDRALFSALGPEKKDGAFNPLRLDR